MAGQPGVRIDPGFRRRLALDRLIAPAAAEHALLVSRRRRHAIPVRSDLRIAIVTILVQLVVVARRFQNIVLGNGIGVRAQARAKEQRGDQNIAFHGNPPCLATIALPCWSRTAAAAVRRAKLQIGKFIARGMVEPARTGLTLASCPWP